MLRCNKWKGIVYHAERLTFSAVIPLNRVMTNNRPLSHCTDLTLLEHLSPILSCDAKTMLVPIPGWMVWGNIFITIRGKIGHCGVWGKVLVDVQLSWASSIILHPTWSLPSSRGSKAIYLVLYGVKRVGTMHLQYAMHQKPTKWNSCMITGMSSYTIFKSGRLSGKCEFGLAFIVDRNFKASVIDFKPAHERLYAVPIKAHPVEESDDVTKEQFYDTFES